MKRLILILFLLMAVNACTSTEPTLEEMMEMDIYGEVPVRDAMLIDIYGEPDVWAKYPGGVETLQHYLLIHTVYPHKERREEIEGMVVVTFKVDVDGYAKDLIAHESPSEGFVELYKEIIEGLDRWIPAFKNGEPIPQRYMIEMEFALD